jgi:hypothetical protein
VRRSRRRADSSRILQPTVASCSSQSDWSASPGELACRGPAVFDLTVETRRTSLVRSVEGEREFAAYVAGLALLVRVGGCLEWEGAADGYGERALLE